MTGVLTPVEHSAVSDLLAEVGKELADLRGRNAVRVLAAHGDGPVTNADLGAQHALLDGLLMIRPSASVVAEEDGLRAAAINTAGGQTVWVVDPIDGTSSYVEGASTWGIQVALCHDNRTVGAWIALPSLGWSIDASDGVALSVRGTPCNPSEGVRIMVADGDFEPLQRERVRISGLQYRGTRSCAVDWSCLTVGHLDAVAYRRTYPWDHLAGAYLAARAGLAVIRWDGSPYPGQSGEGVVATSLRAPSNFTNLFLERSAVARQILDHPVMEDADE